MDSRCFLFLFRYYKANSITASVLLYLLLSAVLKAMLAIDIGIPCLWKLLFHFECPGCGMTTAFTHLLRLDVDKADEANRSIFLLVPAAAGYLCFDFLKFKRRSTAEFQSEAIN